MTTTAATTGPPRQRPTQAKDNETLPATTDENFKKSIVEMDAIATECSLSSLQCSGHISRSVVMADAVIALRQKLSDEIMKRIMALRGSKLGFLTDRDKKPETQQYTVQQVKECFIEATLRGLSTLGNEWNIIAGNCYVTQSGLVRLVGQFEGLTDLKEDYGVPKWNPEKVGAIVACSGSWLLNGNRQELSADIPVKTDEYSSIDQILGKAKRKFLARIYARISGSLTTMPDGDATDVVELDNAEPRPALPDPTAKHDAIDELHPEETGDSPAEEPVADDVRADAGEESQLPPDPINALAVELANIKQIEVDEARQALVAFINQVLKKMTDDLSKSDLKRIHKHIEDGDISVKRATAKT